MFQSTDPPINSPNKNNIFKRPISCSMYQSTKVDRQQTGITPSIGLLVNQ